MRNVTCAVLALVLLPLAAPAQSNLDALRKKLNSAFKSDQEAAANDLARQGASALPAVPDLAAAMKKASFDSTRSAIGTALAKIVVDAKGTVPTLRAELRRANPARRAAINKRLEEIRGGTDKAVDALADALQNRAKFKDERIAIARALGSIGPDARAAVPALAAGLKGGFSEVNVAMAQALGAMGPAASEAVPALTDVSKTGFADVRAAASAALAKIKK